MSTYQTVIGIPHSQQISFATPHRCIYVDRTSKFQPLFTSSSVYKADNCWCFRNIQVPCLILVWELISINPMLQANLSSSRNWRKYASNALTPKKVDFDHSCLLLKEVNWFPYSETMPRIFVSLHLAYSIHRSLSPVSAPSNGSNHNHPAKRDSRPLCKVTTHVKIRLLATLHPCDCHHCIGCVNCDLIGPSC